MADKLLPCPFCGGKAKYHDSSCAEECCEYVSCLKCNAQSPLMYRKGEAVEWWNRRPSPWHTGTPNEEGWYLCKTKASDFSVHYYDGNKWDFCPLDFVIKWQKLKED